MSYAIRNGCILEIDKKYFGGSYRKPTFLGELRLKVKITSHSYGSDKGQHTFTCEPPTIIKGATVWWRLPSDSRTQLTFYRPQWAQHARCQSGLLLGIPYRIGKTSQILCQ